MTREYYQEHRLQLIAKAKERHRIHMESSANYRKLYVVRRRIWDINEAIKKHYHWINVFKQRLKKLNYRKEVLELAWGQERAQRKRNGNILVKKAEK